MKNIINQHKLMMMSSGTTASGLFPMMTRQEERTVKAKIEKMYGRTVLESYDDFYTGVSIQLNNKEIVLGDTYEDIMLKLGQLNNNLRTKKIERLTND